MFDSYWAMLGGASATISGLAFVSITIFYWHLHLIAKNASKKGLEGNITHRYVVKVIKSFAMLISPLILASIMFITHIYSILDFWVLYTVNIAGLVLLIAGLIDIYKPFFYYDINIAVFKCSQKYINSIESSKKQLKDQIDEIGKYFETLTKWHTTLHQVEKKCYEVNKNHYETRIYGNHNDSLSSRHKLLIDTYCADISLNADLTYKKLIELTDIYEELVTDVKKTKEHLKTFIRGLPRIENKWKEFFKNWHPELFPDK